MTEEQEQIKLAHVWSEQPNAIRLRSETMLLPMGETRSFSRGDDTSDSLLAKSLFGLTGVEGIEFDTYSLTATLDEDEDWEELGKLVEAAVKEHLASGQPAVDQPAKEESTVGKFSFGFKEVVGRPREEQMKIVKDLFDSEVNPAIASHGGEFTLIDIKDNNVFVELGGGCQGCGMATVTLKQGVEGRMREVLPEMDQLIDTTDHASGQNPYYQEGK